MRPVNWIKIASSFKANLLVSFTKGLAKARPGLSILLRIVTDTVGGGSSGVSKNAAEVALTTIIDKEPIMARQPPR